MATTNEVKYLEIKGCNLLGATLIAVYALDSAFSRFRVAMEIEEGTRKKLHVTHKSRSGMRDFLKFFRDRGCEFREVCGPDPFPAAHSR